MSIQVESTTDTKEEIVAAMGGKQEPSAEASSEQEVSQDEQQEVVESESGQEVDQDEKEAEESETSEESEDTEEAEVEVEKKPKPKRGFKRRIDKLNSKLSAAEQEKEYWRQQALANQSQETEKESTIQQSDNENQKPSADDFETHEEFIEALSDWKVEQKLQARENASKERQIKLEKESKLTSFQEKVSDFSETVEDFNEVIEDVDDIVMSVAVQECLLESENGPELMYRLAKDPVEYKRICALSPVAAARAIGRFEAKFQKSEPSEVKPKEKIKTSNAPKPPKTLGSRASGGTKKTIYDSDISQREFEKQRMEQASNRIF